MQKTHKHKRDFTYIDRYFGTKIFILLQNLKLTNNLKPQKKSFILVVREHLLFGPMLIGLTKCDEALLALLGEAECAWPEAPTLGGLQKRIPRC